jgi:hypothetical protein
LVLDRDELKKLLKEKGVKSLDDFNAFMRDISKEVVETLLDGELTDHLGYEKHDQKARITDTSPTMIEVVGMEKIFRRRGTRNPDHPISSPRTKGNAIREARIPLERIPR